VRPGRCATKEPNLRSALERGGGEDEGGDACHGNGRGAQVDCGSEPPGCGDNAQAAARPLPVKAPVINTTGLVIISFLIPVAYRQSMDCPTEKHTNPYRCLPGALQCSGI
jgi:hypothetical protein